jgi:hypothetical protein
VDTSYTTQDLTSFVSLLESSVSLTSHAREGGTRAWVYDVVGMNAW